MYLCGAKGGETPKVPGNELARVLLELSLWGANWPGSEKAVNRFGRGLGD